MYSIRRALFGNLGRRLSSLIVANAIFFFVGRLIQAAVIDSVSSPGVSFALVLLWMTLGCVAALFTLIAVGDRVFHRGWSERFLRDEMAELDARIDDGMPLEPLEEDDDVLELTTRDSTFRFGLYYIAIAVLTLFAANKHGGDFLQYYSSHGVAVVHMRSDDAALRRRGLTMLAERLDVDGAHPSIQKVVLRALEDPDEGVAARAAFVAGTLAVDAAAEPLAKMVREQPALAFTALIALGQAEGPLSKKAAGTLLTEPNALAEPRALALALGMLRVRAPELLQRIYAGPTGGDAEARPDDNTRLAAVWALGQVPDGRQLPFLSAVLKDEALVVRCAAADAMERLVELGAYEPLRDAFERSTDALEMCPAAVIPVQEGGRKRVIVLHRNYQLTLVRALSSTDHPDLLKWLVANQVDREWVTYKFMEKKWKQLKEKDARGELNMLKRRIRAQRLKEAAARPPDAGPSAPDAAPSDAEVRPQRDR